MDQPEPAKGVLPSDLTLKKLRLRLTQKRSGIHKQP